MHTDNKMSFGLRIISEILSYFVGLDLGQSRNHSALAVVERAELLLDEIDWVTYERRREWRYRMRFLERVPLGTPYPDVVARVRAVVRNEAIASRCGIEGVILTGGERESHAGGVWHVPKRDLITGLRVSLDNRELGLPANFGPTRALIEELRGMETRMNGGGAVRIGAWREGEQDDLGRLRWLAGGPGGSGARYARAGAWGWSDGGDFGCRISISDAGASCAYRRRLG